MALQFTYMHQMAKPLQIKFWRWIIENDLLHFTIFKKHFDVVHCGEDRPYLCSIKIKQTKNYKVLISLILRYLFNITTKLWLY